MTKGRLEAFSDGVVAILITIMVLELKVPADGSWSALADHGVRANLLAYLLSFVFIAIYWNNHHHMLHLCTRVNGAVLWANTHLLFWLSLVPFATKWMDESFSTASTATYSALMLCCSIAFTILAMTLARVEGPDSKLAKIQAADVKGKISVALNVLAVAMAFVLPILSVMCITIVALIWLVPDRRVERVIGERM